MIMQIHNMWFHMDLPHEDEMWGILRQSKEETTNFTTDNANNKILGLYYEQILVLWNIHRDIIWGLTFGSPTTWWWVVQ